jgi:hypothetical protein
MSFRASHFPICPPHGQLHAITDTWCPKMPWARMIPRYQVPSITQSGTPCCLSDYRFLWLSWYQEELIVKLNCHLNLSFGGNSGLLTARTLALPTKPPSKPGGEGFGSLPSLQGELFLDLHNCFLPCCGISVHVWPAVFSLFHVSDTIPPFLWLGVLTLITHSQTQNPLSLPLYPEFSKAIFKTFIKVSLTIRNNCIIKLATPLNVENNLQSVW